MHREHVKVAHHKLLGRILLLPFTACLHGILGWGWWTAFGHASYGQNQFIKASIDNIKNMGKCDQVHNVNLEDNQSTWALTDEWIISP